MFSYMYCEMYEDLLSKNIQLRMQVTELEHQNEALLQDKEDLEEEKSNDTIQAIDIDFSNSKELRIDRLITHELEELIKNENKEIIRKDIKRPEDNNKLI